MARDSTFAVINGGVETLIQALRNRVLGTSPEQLDATDGHHQRRSSKDDEKTTETALTTIPRSPAAKPRSTLSSSPDSARPLPRLMTLPPELQVLIVRNLDFSDMQRLRQTCHFYRTLVSRDLVRTLLGGGSGLKLTLLSHCSRCLKWDPTRQNLLVADLANPAYPFCSACFDCAARAGQLVVGKRVTLGNYDSAWVCKWCGYPVHARVVVEHHHYHDRCYRWYFRALVMYAVLGWTQFCLVVVGTALCLTYFRGNKYVLGCCITGLIVSILPLVIMDLRTPGAKRTYHCTFLLELLLLVLWMVPTWAIAQTLEPDTKTPRTTTVTLTLCCFNILFRFLNSIGNLVLLCEYKIWKRKKPNVGPWMRAWHRVVACLVFWTFPRAVEQHYPPKWWGMCC